MKQKNVVNLKMLYSLTRVIVFFVVFFLIFNAVTYVLRDKNEAEFLYPYYAENIDHEVLFLGPSTARDAFYPLEFYGQYGISSYNIAQGGQYFAPNYYLLKDIIEVQNKSPKVVVLDVFDATITGKAYESTERLHELADNMPFWSLKFEMLYNLLDDKKDISQFLFPISIFHSRWNELNEKDFKKIENPYMGADFSLKIEEYEQPQFVDSSVKTSLDEISLGYLLKIIELCKKNNIELIMTALPFNNKVEQRLPYLNAVQEVADSNNIKYFNFWYLLQECQLDFKTDFRNANHLNSSYLHS